MNNVFEDFASRQPGGGILTVKRSVTHAPAYVNGYPAADAVTTFATTPTQCNPVSGRDLKILADQGITAESMMLLSATKLLGRNQTNEPDRLSGIDLDDDGATWVVVNAIRRYAPDGDVFYHCIVARDATQ